ncbi:HMG domain-containing 3 isoform X2 [Labeo rohita]|uniref:HMG domain-containing 3 isoform X2 n=1 Tax=Labeo rohita TaxID=84645 RepID=A0A498M5S2_LABRO|nr:HMG domain-containing 3 isoform X2 [Labeo rohita]
MLLTLPDMVVQWPGGTHKSFIFQDVWGLGYRRAYCRTGVISSIANQCFQLIAALAASQGKDVFAVNSYVVVTWLPPYNNDPWPALPVKNWQVTFHPAIGTCLYWQILSQVQQLVTLEQELPNPDDMMEVTPPESDSMEITPTPGIYDSAVMKNILLACKWVEENQHHFAGKIELPKILKMKEEDALLAITMRDLFINTMFYEESPTGLRQHKVEEEILLD